MKLLLEDELEGQINIDDYNRTEAAKQLYDQIKDKNNIDEWFKVLVPQSGEADSVAGEIVRALERIMYRSYNDGDVFYSGYGVETCGGSVGYLCDVLPEGYYDRFEQIANRELKDDDYDKAIDSIAKDVIDYLNKNIELISTPNAKDSRADYDLPEELEVKYDFSCDLPYDLIELIDSGRYDEQSVKWDLESWDGISNAESFDIQGGTLYVDGLDEYSYNELEKHCEKWLEDYTEELLQDIGDEEE